MRDLLFLCQRIPYPPNKGDKIRAFHVLQHLAAKYRIHLGCFIDKPSDEKYIADLEKICASVECIPIGFLKRPLAGLQASLSGKSISEVYFHDSRLAGWVHETVARHQIQSVFVFSSSMAPYAIDIPARKIIDIVDVDSEKWRSYAQESRWPMNMIYHREQRLLQKLEKIAATRFDHSLFVSTAEMELFRRLNPALPNTALSMSNGVDLTYFDPALQYQNPFRAGAKPIVFTGAMNYRPNIEAVCWFANTVFPGVRKADPTAEFWIVGMQPTSDIVNLSAAPNIFVTAEVPDIRPYLAHASCVVAPLQIARGIQNKVLEAFAMAKPVVATGKALEGITASAGTDVARADSAVDFLSAVLAVLSGGHEELGRNGRARVEKDYRWEGSLSILDQLFAASQSSHERPV